MNPFDTSRIPLAPLDEIHRVHAFAFADLRAYAAEDEETARLLAPILNAPTSAHLVLARHTLARFVACSAAIDDLGCCLTRMS